MFILNHLTRAFLEPFRAIESPSLGERLVKLMPAIIEGSSLASWELNSKTEEGMEAAAFDLGGLESLVF